MQSDIYLVALHKIGLDQKKLSIIFKEKENYKEIFDNLDTSLLSSLGFNLPKIKIILDRKKDINLDKLKEIINKLKIRIITIHSTDYPNNLRNIFNVPYLLYVRGNINYKSLAFVGSRTMSSYGQKVIKKIIPEVGRYFCIVSGGAAGCDTESHKIALANNIKTISVLGTGIDKNYPAENKKLFDQIVDNNGGIISIFPIGESGNPYNFPIRNEIVAGLSEGVVVIEAKEKSGSLITARLGLELSKEVFAVPGDILKDLSAGTNNLILTGEAKIICSGADILSEYNISFMEGKKAKKEISFNDEEEKNIYELLILESLDSNQISERLGLDISYTLLKVSMLELSNLIKKGFDGKYEIV